MFSKIEKKEGKEMSLVLLFCTQKGVVGVADSKSTIEYQDGYRIEDTKRGDVPKVFGNHEFIFVTHGRNTMFEGMKEVNIEDWIQDNLQDDDTPMQFFSKFKEVFEGVAIPPTKYTFGVGSRDAKGYTSNSRSMSHWKQ